MGYLVVMLLAILGIIVYGAVKRNEQIGKTGVVLLAVWVACAAGYYMFA